MALGQEGHCQMDSNGIFFEKSSKHGSVVQSIQKSNGIGVHDDVK